MGTRRGARGRDMRVALNGGGGGDGGVSEGQARGGVLYISNSVPASCIR